MRGRITEALRVGLAAVVGSGVATFAMRDGRAPAAAFVGHLLAVLVFTAIAWFALLTFRTRAN